MRRCPLAARQTSSCSITSSLPRIARRMFARSRSSEPLTAAILSAWRNSLMGWTLHPSAEDFEHPGEEPVHPLLVGPHQVAELPEVDLGSLEPFGVVVDDGQAVVVEPDLADRK